MKTVWLVIICSFGMCLFLHDASGQTNQVDTAQPLGEIGPHHRIVRTTRVVTEEDGTLSTIEGSYVALATGMNYVDDSGNYQTAIPEFELLNGQAVARRTYHKVILTGSPTDANPVDILMPDGARLVNRCLGLAWYDASTAKSVLFAELRDVAGELSPSKNLVTYSDCFTGTKASLRYRLRLSGLEADVVLEEQPPDPATFGLNRETCRLEVITELLQSPMPKITTNILKQEDDPQKRATLAVPDFTNEDLDFGVMFMPIGRAFTVPSELEDGSALASVVVGKDFEIIDNRMLLFESVLYPDIKPLLDDLPAAPQAKIKSTNEIHVASSRQEMLPAFRKTGESNRSVLMAQASAPHRAVVLDWTLVTGTNSTFIFQATNTYFIKDQVVITSSAEFQGGAVIKFTNHPNAEIMVTGGVAGSNPTYRPVIFTSSDDDSVGEKIGTGVPSGYYGGAMLHYANASLPMTLDNAQFRYAKIGCQIDNTSNHILRNVQFVKCSTGLSLNQTGCNVHNVLNYASQNAFVSNNSLISGEQVTIHQAAFFTNSSGFNFITFKNSLFVTVTNMGTFVPDSSNQVRTNDTGVFQTVGAGAHYLASPTQRGVGGTNIDATLLASLRLKTTYPPQVMTGAISTNTVWGTQVPRDTGSLLDLGFHYPVLDYAVGQCVVTNATLVITNQVQVGVYTDFGLQPHNGGTVRAEGSPTNFVRFVRYDQAQEGANTNWAGITTVVWRIFKEKWTLSGSPAPEIHLRLTEIPLMAHGGARFTGSSYPTRISLTDCHISSESLFSTAPTVDLTIGITNSSFARVDLNLGSVSGNTMIAYARNNLFSSCYLTLNPQTGNKWEWRDNFFSFSTNIQNAVTFTNSHNAYQNSATLAGSLGSDKTNSNFGFMSGPLGFLYYTGGDSRVDAGSRAANLASLYHHTTNPNQAKEAFSTVDIGFHFIATISSSSTQPNDFESDGGPDYWEDRNGNGVFNIITTTNVFDTTTNNFYSFETDWKTNWTLRTSFAGPYDDASAGAVPPDTMGAVGPGHFITLINQGIYVFDRQGNYIPLPNNGLLDFFKITLFSPNSPRGGGAFDPRIIYDHQSQRWIACALELEGPVSGSNLGNDLVLAVSKDSNPVKFGTNSTWASDNWNKFLVRVGQDTNHSDFDTLGVDGNGVYIAMLKKDSLNALHHNSIFAIPKASLLNPANPQTELLPTRFDDSTAGKFFIQPAVNFDSVGATDPAWFVEAKHDVGDNRISYKTLTWSGQTPGTPTGWSEVVNTGITYSAVPTNNIPQPSSGTFTLVDPLAGLSMAIIRSNTLWTCHAAGFSSPTRSGCQWLSFTANVAAKTLAYSASGSVVDSARWYYCPSLMVNTRGEMLMGFSGSSASDYVSAFFVTRSTSGAIGSVFILKQGEAATFNNTRPGDYSYTSLDPNDGLTFWTIQEHASALGGQAGPPWGTWIGGVSPF